MSVVRWVEDVKPGKNSVWACRRVDVLVIVLRNTASHTQGLEGSQTSPRRLKLREATAGRPLYKMAALSVASSRLPGTTQRKVLPIASFLLSGYNVLLWGYDGP